MKKKAIVILGVVLIIAISLGWLQYQRGRYEKVQVGRGNIQIVVTAPGKIEAEKKANLAFKTTGRISFLPFKENDNVKKSQTVASLDQSDLVAVKEKELKNYLDARWNWEQQRENYGIEGNYQTNPNLSDTQKRAYEKEQFSLDRSVIDVEIAGRAIENSTLYAPFDGIVTQVNGEVNEWTNTFSSTPLIQVVDFSTLYFEAEIDQENSDSIKVGQKAIVKLDAKKGDELSGVISKIAKVTNTTTGGDTVVLVKIKLNENSIGLKLGWEGDAQIVLKEKTNVILIPKKAVEREDGEVFVLLWQGQQTTKRKIKLGTFDGTYWEVTEGISESEEIAIPK